LIFLDRFSKEAQILSFIKVRPVGAELIHADRRTDITKLIVAFRNFANARKNECHGVTMKVIWAYPTSLAIGPAEFKFLLTLLLWVYTGRLNRVAMQVSPSSDSLCMWRTLRWLQSISVHKTVKRKMCGRTVFIGLIYQDSNLHVCFNWSVC
jgi:hypothetical protein